MCPLETGLGSTFNETYFSLFQDAVNYITAQGGYVVLDAHNYMRMQTFPFFYLTLDLRFERLQRPFITTLLGQCDR